MIYFQITEEKDINGAIAVVQFTLNLANKTDKKAQIPHLIDSFIKLNSLTRVFADFKTTFNPRDLETYWNHVYSLLSVSSFLVTRFWSPKRQSEVTPLRY